MYPFTDDNVYLKNCWYVAAAARELDGGPIERTIMDNPVALFRLEDGTPTAMHGVCPHRYYPLARGKVRGDALQCNYHGFRFDGRTGSCVHVPGQPAPKSFRQRIYPVAEHGDWIWIWPGEPELADRNLLPPLDVVGLGPGWTVQVSACMHGEGRAHLLVENLLDLTHIDYLHATALDAEGVLDAPVKLREESGMVYASRHSQTPWVEGFYDILFGSEHRFEGMHDSVGETLYWSPAYLRTGLVITAIDGKPSVDRSIYGHLYFQHFLTPETPHSCHYFSGTSRDYRHADVELDQIMAAMDAEVRQQDLDAIKEVETQLARPWTLGQELLTRSDGPAIQVRRMIQKQLDEEAAARRVSQPAV